MLKYKLGRCVAAGIAGWVCIGSLALGVVFAADLPKQSPVTNVSSDPTGKAPPVISLPDDEQTPHKVSTPHGIGALEADQVDYSVKLTGAEAAWAKGLTGKGVKVAVLDTGCDLTHKDLKDAIVASKDFTNSPSGANDKNGHGTHTAGSVGARKNGWGMVGAAYECDLIIGKVLGDSGSGSVDGIAAGIDWAVEQGADVISMSLGGPGTDTYIPAAFARADAAGVLLVVAAGNDGNGRPVNYPGAYPQAIAISAVDSAKRLASFSCTGAKIELCGPGVNVRSTYPGDRFADMSGTSMATPNVAGALALAVQADQKAYPGDKKGRPKRFKAGWSAHVEDLGAAGRDSSYGFGLIKADSYADVTPPPPPPQPKPGKGVQLDETDLNDKGKQKLKDGGLKGFKWEFTVGDTPPPPPDAPSLTADEVKKLLESGKKLKLFHKVPPDLRGYPDGFVFKDGEVDLPPDMPPGVYEVTLHVQFGFKPVDGK